MRAVLSVSALALLWFGTAVAVAAPVTSSERKKLAKAFGEYVREADAKRRKAIWKGVSTLAKKLTIEEIEALIADAVPGRTWKAGYTDKVEFASAGETWSYSALLPKKKPKRIALVLDVGHGTWKDADAKKREDGMALWLRTARCAKDVVYIRTRVIDATALDGRYDTWSRPNKKKGEPNLDTFAAVLMDAVRDACLRYPIDPDRVYVQGISQTGFWTWWLAQFAPDRWAAVAPVGSVTWHVKRLLPNVARVPVFVLHGSADPTCPFVQAQEAVDELKRLGGEVDFRPTEGGGHMNGVYTRFGEIWPEAMKRTRAPFPKAFERQLLSDARPDAFWLRAIGVDAKAFNLFRGAPCRVAGTIEGQTLKVEAKGCDEVVVLISSQMVDTSRNVTIELNGKRAWKKKPKPDARTALDVARMRGDGRGFGSAVTLKVK